MFLIKIKVKGYLKNLTENKEELFNANAIKKENEINYINEDTKYKIIIEKNKVKLVRENNTFSHGMTFELNKSKSSEYYLKEYNNSLEFNILTTKLIIKENKIDITYKVMESENIYNYVLEMSDN